MRKPANAPIRADRAAAAHELQAVEGVVIQAGVRPNPEIATMVEDTQNKASRTTTVQINQAIELGGKRAARIESAEHGRDVTTADLATQRLGIRAATVAAFFDVLIAQERVRLFAPHSASECGILHELVAAAHGKACACRLGSKEVQALSKLG